MVVWQTISSQLNFRPLMGWMGTGSFWVSEHYEAIAGMVVSVAMMIASIILQYMKVRAIMNEERRKEEKHQQEMRQDQERHNLDLGTNQILDQ